MAFIPVSDLSAARSFYSGVLGIQVAEESPYAVVMDAGGTMLRLTQVDGLRPQPFTVAGWRVLPRSIHRIVPRTTRVSVIARTLFRTVVATGPIEDQRRPTIWKSLNVLCALIAMLLPVRHDYAEFVRVAPDGMLPPVHRPAV